MILCIVSPQQSLRTQTCFAKVAGYQINIKSSCFSVYHQQTHQKKKSRKQFQTIPVTIAWKIHGGRNLTKDVNDFYNEKFKTGKKLVMTAEDGKISYDSEVEDLIFWIWPFFQKEFMDLMKSK